MLCIHSHVPHALILTQMCLKFQELLGRKSTTDYQQLWSAYERTYFADVMFSLERLYALAYSNVLTGLEQSLPKLTPGTLAMDNELFEDRAASPRLEASDVTETGDDEAHDTLSQLPTAAVVSDAAGARGGLTAAAADDDSSKPAVFRPQSDPGLGFVTQTSLDDRNGIVSVPDPITGRPFPRVDSVLVEYVVCNVYMCTSFIWSELYQVLFLVVLTHGLRRCIPATSPDSVKLVHELVV